MVVLHICYDINGIHHSHTLDGVSRPLWMSPRMSMDTLV